MKNTSLLCLSSPEGDSNYYSQLMNLKRDDNPEESFFRVLECAQICKECRKLDRVLQIACNHVRQTAHWLSSRKIRELKTLYKASPEDAIREFGGIVMSDNLPAFRKEEIARIFALPPHEQQAAPPYIFVCCDPSGGGLSMLSIVSGYYTGVDTVVVSVCDTSKFCCKFAANFAESLWRVRSFTCSDRKCCWPPPTQIRAATHCFLQMANCTTRQLAAPNASKTCQTVRILPWHRPRDCRLRSRL